MVLSDFGEVVEEELLKSFDIRSELTCNNYVIMPNHLHMLVSLSKTTSLKKLKTKPSSLEPRSISSFIGGFKSAATIRINIIRGRSGEKVWHPRFYDHIIRDTKDFDYIFAYISNNPKTWKNDRFHEKLNNEGDSNQYPDNL
jgi:REP element-mobilizing transposase RayT